MRIDIKWNTSDVVDKVATGIKFFRLFVFVDVFISFNEILKGFFKLLEIIVE